MLGKEENQEHSTNTEAVNLVTKKFIDNFIADYNQCVDKSNCESFLQFYRKFFDSTLNQEAFFLTLLAQSSEKAAIISSANELIDAQLPENLTPEKKTFYLLRSTFIQIELFLVSFKVQLIPNEIKSTTDYDSKMGELTSLLEEYINISENLLDKNKTVERKIFRKYFGDKATLLEENYLNCQNNKEQNIAQSPYPKTPAKNKSNRAQSTPQTQDNNSSPTPPLLVSENKSNTSSSQQKDFKAQKLFTTASENSATAPKKNPQKKKAHTQPNNNRTTRSSRKEQQLTDLGNAAAQHLLDSLSARKGIQQLNTNSQNSTTDTNANNSNNNGKSTQNVEPVLPSTSTGQSMPQPEKIDNMAEKADEKFAGTASKSASKRTTNTNLSTSTTTPNVNEESSVQPTNNESTLISSLDLATHRRSTSNANSNADLSKNSDTTNPSFKQKQELIGDHLVKQHNNKKPSSQFSSTSNNIVDQSNTQNPAISNESQNLPINKPEFLTKIIAFIPKLNEKNENYLAREKPNEKSSITDVALKKLPSYQLSQLINSLKEIDTNFKNDSNVDATKQDILAAINKASPVLSQERKFWGQFVNGVNRALNLFTCGFFGKHNHITKGKSMLNQIENIVNKETACKLS